MAYIFALVIRVSCPTLRIQDAQRRNFLILKEPVVAYHIVKVLYTRLFAPPDIVVSRFQRPLRCAEGHRSQIPMPRTLDYIAYLLSAESATSKVMMLIQQRPPDARVFAISACNRNYLYLPQLRQ